MRKKNPQLCLLEGSRICDKCRKQLAQTIPETPLLAETQPSTSSSPPSSSIASPEVPELDHREKRLESLEAVTKCLEDLGETPITLRKLRSKKYSKNKMAKIVEKMDQVIIDVDKSGDDREIIQQLKEKFLTLQERSVKIQILTVLPKSWSLAKIQAEFGASNFMARKAKQLVIDKGVLSSPDPQPGHCLTQTTVHLVVSFYNNDSSSRMMPGKKDFVSVKADHGREHVQKRLILSNLKELYQDFKQKHPTERIGFSKFAELRPKHCVLAGASGTHSVCVCTIHQNVKLMLKGLKINEATSRGLTNYHTCLAIMMCNPPLPTCCFGECDYCPGIEKLILALLD